MADGALFPQIPERQNQVFDVLNAVRRRGCKSQPLRALGHGGAVDRLHVISMALREEVRQHPALDRVLDHHWDNV